LEQQTTMTRRANRVPRHGRASECFRGLSLACIAACSAGWSAVAATQPVDASPAAQATTPATKDGTAETAPKQVRKTDRQVRAEAEEALRARYVIAPGTADELGYRIVWQTEPLVTKDATMQVTTATADSVWFGDSAGSVVRIRRDSGETVWRSSTYQGVERMIGIEYLPTPQADNVYVVTELGSVTLDAVTGNLLKRGRFAHLPMTEPTVFGPYMIFGTRTGLASWYQYKTGYNWRAATVGAAVHGKVTITGDTALAAGTNGKVMALGAPNAGIRWTRTLSAGVEAPIAADDSSCYVASRDQSLWAFDLMRGRVLWQYFTQAALVNPPVRIADGLYLQIPGEGLVSFNPTTGKPDGEVRWKSKAKGNVLARVGTDLMAWDAAGRTLTAVDAGTGRIVREVALPKVKAVVFDTARGDLFVSDESGNVERLEHLSKSGRATQPEPVADASQAPN
jgi:outer membrane protein assembly factor BamB